ncbi:MAG: hypothetical protein EA388_15665 [Nitriliruptor sp.]|nr:MAG: hypothetical protein EA388_15665 [Nitriliruptor sp.]
MRDIGRVVALAPNRTEAESTRADLAFRSIRAEVLHAGAGSYVLEDETLREDVDATQRGILLGLLAGALVGLAVVLLVPAVRGWDPVFQLLLVAGFALQGTMPAIMWRLGRGDRYDDDPVTVRDLDPDDWLVVVHDPHDAVRAHHVVERHSLVFLEDEEPLLPAV